MNDNWCYIISSHVNLPLIIFTIQFSGLMLTLTLLVLKSIYSGIIRPIPSMAADAPAPCVTRASATIVLTMQDKRVLVFYKEKFQLPAPYQQFRNDWKIYCYIFPKNKLIITRVNSSPPSAAYMRHWTGSALVQIMACRLFGAKPLSKPMLDYHQMNT